MLIIAFLFDDNNNNLVGTKKVGTVCYLRNCCIIRMENYSDN